MRVQEILQGATKGNCMQRNICMLKKLYQWAINPSKNNQEDSNDRRTLKQIALALH